MVALYGNKNGFGWKLDETIGAQIISVPMDIAEGSIWRNLGLFFDFSFFIFLVLLQLCSISCSIDT